MPATFAGNRKRSAVTAVSSYYFICSHTKLMDTLYFSVQRHVRPQAVKKEPKSPNNSTSSKWKVYSTNSANPIGSIHPIDFDFDASQQGSSKRQKTASGGSSHVQFDGVIVLPMFTLHQGPPDS